MSVTFNGSSQFAHIVAVPSATERAIVGWFRRNADSGGSERWFATDDGGFFERSGVQVNTADQAQGTYQFTSQAPSFTPAAVTWYYVMFRFSGGTMQVRHCADGDEEWQSNISTAGLSALAATATTIGAVAGAATPGDFAPLTCAMFTVWSGTLPTDAELLAHRLSRAMDPDLLDGLWAHLPFDDEDALGADVSGNDRTFTLTGAPTYTADAPADLASAPTFASVSPNTGPVGTEVTGTLTNGTGATGATIPASSGDIALTSFVLVDAETFTAVIPAGATTGPITLLHPSGDVEGPVFTVTPTPVYAGVEITNTNTDHTLGAALDTITVRAVDQFGDTWLGAIPAVGGVSANHCGITSRTTRTVTPLVEVPFVAGIATFENLVPTLPPVVVARGFRVLMHHYA